MFVVQAHSFVQQARLAITLAWVAGYTNILTILMCGHVTSHASGTTSDLGRDVVEGSWGKVAFGLFLLGAFLVGAMLSGLTTEVGRRKGWESIYVLPMGLEAVLLAGFALGIELHTKATLDSSAWLYVMTGLASAAMGLQNATITRISSGVVRTTHVTGVLTDLGIESMRLILHLRDQSRKADHHAGDYVKDLHDHPSGQRLLLLASIIGSFAFGAGLGTLIHDLAWTQRWAMFPPVVFLAWIVYQDVKRPIAEIEPSNLEAVEGLEKEHALVVYRLSVDRRRSARATQRMPNLLAWSERLPPSARVVVLDLGDVRRLDTNSALELRALLTQMAMQSRRLIIAGLNHEQVVELRRSGVGDLLSPNQVCPDVELAIALGLNGLDDGLDVRA